MDMGEAEPDAASMAIEAAAVAGVPAEAESTEEVETPVETQETATA